MGGEFRGEWIDAYYMAGSLQCSPETITTLFVNQLYPSTKGQEKKCTSWAEISEVVPWLFLDFECNKVRSELLRELSPRRKKG